MDELWGEINPKDWRTTPAVNGRIATEDDVRAGRAVFFVKDGARPSDVDLPCCGLQTLETGEVQPVIVIQAEVIPDGTLYGVRPLTGGNGLCLAHEVQLLPDGFSG